MIVLFNCNIKRLIKCNAVIEGRKAFHNEALWCLIELMKVAVEIIAGSLFQGLTTCIKKDDFLRRHQSEPFKTLNGWLLKPGNND